MHQQWHTGVDCQSSGTVGRREMDDLIWGNNILTPNAGTTLVTSFKPGLNVILLSYSKEGCLDFQPTL